MLLINPVEVFTIVESILVFIVDFFASILFYFYTPKSKLEKNIDKLIKEDWFAALYDDFRYSHIIWHNRKVKRFLMKYENVESLMNNEQDREKFIHLIKQEHNKFVSFNKN